jgi:hypothetical protein
MRIGALIDDPDRALRLAGAAHRKILERHTFEHAGTQLETIAREVAARWR